MNIDAALKDLGKIDFEPLREAVLGLPEKVWRENDVRQKTFDVHQSTESIVLLFVSMEKWPEIVVSQESGWEHLSGVAMPLIDSILQDHYDAGGLVIRAMAAKLLPAARIMPHVDRHQSFHQGHRIHIPLTTNPRVRFSLDGRPQSLSVGHAYEINNQKSHSVMNNSDEDRIHFIFDYVPPSELDGPNQARN